MGFRVCYHKTGAEDTTRLYRSHEELNDKLNAKTKEQLIAEIIFLTHKEQLHEVNMNWHPKAEEVLCRPEIQEVKYSQTVGRNVRYKREFKKHLVELHLPYCKIRYAF